MDGRAERLCDSRLGWGELRRCDGSSGCRGRVRVLDVAWAAGDGTGGAADRTVRLRRVREGRRTTGLQVREVAVRPGGGAKPSAGADTAAHEAAPSGGRAERGVAKAHGWASSAHPVRGGTAVREHRECVVVMKPGRVVGATSGGVTPRPAGDHTPRVVTPFTGRPGCALSPRPFVDPAAAAAPQPSTTRRSRGASLRTRAPSGPQIAMSSMRAPYRPSR